jgi:hypothetical protein
MHDLRLVTAFALHTIAAVLLFALIGGAAALLNYYTRFLETAGMPLLVIKAIHLTEYFLFGIDLVCFLVYVTREAWLLLRQMLVLPPHHSAADAAAPTGSPR